MMLRMDPLTTIEEAYALAHIRNECRLMMTNDQREITPSAQKDWFEHFYLKQDPKFYRVWLLKENCQGIETSIGYLAAKEEKEGIYITEGLLPTKRGQGFGSFMLENLLSKNLFADKPLYADIFNHNLASVLLHQKYKFKMHSSVKDEVSRFVLEQPRC